MTTASPVLPDETSYLDVVTPLGSSAPYHDIPITNDVSSRTPSTHANSYKLDFLRGCNRNWSDQDRIYDRYQSKKLDMLYTASTVGSLFSLEPPTPGPDLEGSSTHALIVDPQPTDDTIQSSSNPGGTRPTRVAA